MSPIVALLLESRSKGQPSLPQASWSLTVPPVPKISASCAPVQPSPSQSKAEEPPGRPSSIARSPSSLTPAKDPSIRSGMLPLLGSEPQAASVASGTPSPSESPGVGGGAPVQEAEPESV